MTTWGRKGSHQIVWIGGAPRQAILCFTIFVLTSVPAAQLQERMQLGGIECLPAEGTMPMQKPAYQHRKVQGTDPRAKAAYLARLRSRF